MKVVIAFVCAVVGYGLFSFDYSSFAEWYAALSYDSRGGFYFASYIVGAAVVWASSNIIFPDVDDECDRFFGSMFWLPLAVVVPVWCGGVGISQLLKYVGRSLRK